MTIRTKNFKNLFFPILLAGVIIGMATHATGGLRAKRAASYPQGIFEAVVFATNSVLLHRDVQVLSGDVIVNDQSDGPTLGPGAELVVDQGVTAPMDSAFKADSVIVNRNAVLLGEVHYSSDLINNGTIGTVVPGLALPVFEVLPPFVAESPRPEAEDILVPVNGTITLHEHDYGTIRSLRGAAITFSGGLYRVGTLDIGRDNEVFFQGPTTLIIEDKLETDKNTFVGPVDGSGIGAADIIIYVNGMNGTTGELDAVPKAVEFGRNSEVRANIYAPNGTIVFNQGGTAIGAFLGKDVDINRDVTVELDSYYANRPPLAEPQNVLTDGTTPLEIILRGIDPDGDDLTFSIIQGPLHGALGPVIEGPPPFPGDPPGCQPEEDPNCIPPVPPRTSASVTYTAYTADNIEDSFVFQVNDGHGGIATANISINPGPEVPPDPPPTTVVVEDLWDQTLQDTSLTISLSGEAPLDVSLTFSIIQGSGPYEGVVTDFTQGTEVPQRTATVTYTPNQGYLGEDSFGYQACGTIGEQLVCESAQVTIIINEPPSEPGELAEDQQVDAFSNMPVEIILKGMAGGAIKSKTPRAAWLMGAKVAGNVADADGDGYGDNHNALPGPAPILVSAAVDATGGPGSNGTMRIHMEWDISNLAGSVDDLQTADVILNTHRNSIEDSLDTFFFFAGSEGNGTLEDTDFESAAELIPGAIMPVPIDMNPGDDGAFSFDVLAELKTAITAGFDYFTIQGRVDEGLAGGGVFQRGLEVYSTADGNLEYFWEPKLSLTTPGVVAPDLEFTVLTLPLYGTLMDALGNPIGQVPAIVYNPTLTYIPNQGYVGTDQFDFQVKELFGEGRIDTAVVSITVYFCDCNTNKLCCDNGR